jgi:hypothetical protein
MRRFGLTVVAAATLLLVGCGDDINEPPRGAGIYRLVSVNGRALPVYFAPSTGLPPILSGDLHLRADGTFGLGVQCSLCSLIEGAWQRDGADLRLTGHDAATIDARIEGDSVTLTFSGVDNVYVFKRDRSRSADPTRVSGTYVVTALMGRPDLTYEMTRGEGSSEIFRIEYDSLTILDGLFFRHARKEMRLITSAEDPDGSPIYVSSMTGHGAYDVEGDLLLLRHYASQSPAVDSVWILPNGLERRRPNLFVDWRETYTRVQ